MSVTTEIYSGGKFTDGIDKAKINQFLHSDEKCAALLFPWNTIDVEEISKQALVDNSNRIDEYNEVFEIIKHTRRPIFVREAAMKFLEELRVNDFILMHWRYDTDDYFRNALPKKKEAMSLIKSVHESEKRTRELAFQLSKIMQSRNTRSIYFASPPSEKPFLQKLLRELNGTKKPIESKMLESFLKREFSKCDEILRDFDDLLSLVEMELSFLSSTFIYSCFSTWR